MNRSRFFVLGFALVTALLVSFFVPNRATPDPDGPTDSAALAQRPVRATPSVEPNPVDVLPRSNSTTKVSEEPSVASVTDAKDQPAAVLSPLTPSGPLNPNATEAAPHQTTDAGVVYPTDKKGISRAMRSAVKEIRECYEGWVQADPKLQGVVRLEFTIDANDAGAGQVTEVFAADGGPGTLAFQGCLRSVVADLQFEPPESGSIRVSYPFSFRNFGTEQTDTVK